MNKTQFKNELIKHGFKCLRFKNDMIFEKSDILYNIEYIGNKYQIYFYDNITLYGDYLKTNNHDLKSLINVINNFHDEYNDL